MKIWGPDVIWARRRRENFEKQDPKTQICKGKSVFPVSFFGTTQHQRGAPGGAKITQDLKLKLVPPLFKKPKGAIGGGQVSGIALIGFSTRNLPNVENLVFNSAKKS